MRNIFFRSKDVCTFGICVCKFSKGTKLSFPQCTTMIQWSLKEVCEKHFWTGLFFFFFFPPRFMGVGYVRQQPLLAKGFAPSNRNEASQCWCSLLSQGLDLLHQKLCITAVLIQCPCCHGFRRDMDSWADSPWVYFLLACPFFVVGFYRQESSACWTRTKRD